MTFFNKRNAVCAAILALGSSAIPAQASFGFCSQPMAPSAFLNKPNKPYCVSSRTCSEWDVSNYRNQVRSYYESLNRYAHEVDSYYDNASRYVKCMSDLD